MNEKTQHKIEDAKLQNCMLEEIHKEYNKKHIEKHDHITKRDKLVAAVLKESDCLKKLKWEIKSEDNDDCCQSEGNLHSSSLMYLVSGIDMDTTLTCFRVGDSLSKDIKAIISPDANEIIKLTEDYDKRGQITLFYEKLYDTLVIKFKSFKGRKACSLEWALQFAQEYKMIITNKSFDSWYINFIKPALEILQRIDKEFDNYTSSFSKK